MSIEKTVDALKAKFESRDVVELKLKNGREVIVAYDNREEDYTLYEGCELVVGNVNLKHIAKCLIQMNDDKEWR